MIIVTFALREESRDFIRLLDDVSREERAELSSLAPLTGMIGAHRVLVVHTGVGEAVTRERLELLPRLVNDEPVECLITAGFAGGLDPEILAGTLILAENYSTPDLLLAAQNALGKGVRVGILATTDSVLETPEAKAVLREKTWGMAVDMETAATAAFCEEWGVPMLSLRVITDSAQESLPVPFPVWFDAATQRPRPLALLRYLILHPARILPFARFVCGVNRARGALTEALVDLLEHD